MSKDHQMKFLLPLAVLCCAVQYVLSVSTGILPPLVSSFVLLLAGVLLGLTGIRYSLYDQLSEVVGTRTPTSALIATGIFFSGAIIVAILLTQIFKGYTIDVNDLSRSDIIPLVITMVERWLDGSYPYAPTDQWPYTITPTYMPMIWMPFVVAEYFNFDYRWVPYGLLTIAICCYQYRLYRKSLSPTTLAVVSALPWLAWIGYVLFDRDSFAVGIESINVAYYLLLGLALLSKRTVWIGITVGFCLLSRFSLVLWLPLLGICYLMLDYKKAATIVLVSLAMELLFYVIPFLSQDVTSFTDSLGSYTVAAVAEWQHTYDAVHQRPYHLYRGRGMAAFYFEYLDGDLSGRVTALQRSHLILSIGSVLVMLLFYWKTRDRIRLPIFLLSTLVIYFAIFYGFIQVPYSYLFMVPAFISILLISELICYRTNSNL